MGGATGTFYHRAGNGVPWKQISHSTVSLEPVKETLINSAQVQLANDTRGVHARQSRKTSNMMTIDAKSDDDVCRIHANVEYVLMDERKRPATSGSMTIEFNWRRPVERATRVPAQIWVVKQSEAIRTDVMKSRVDGRWLDVHDCRRHAE